MIANKFIKPTLAALKARLASLPYAGSWDRASHARLDCEEALRLAMVKVFPRVARKEDLPPDLQESLPALLAALGAAPLEDIRYIDCLNNLYEAWRDSQVAGIPAQFAAIYRERLERQISALEECGASHCPPAITSPNPHLEPIPFADSSQLRVLILASSIFAAGRVLQSVSRVMQVRPDVLCLGIGQSKWRFFSQFALKAPISLLKFPRLLSAIFRGEVRLAPRGLSAPEVQEAIRAKGYDVGIHAAGVIYRRQHIELFRLGILNAHVGLLPEYRGRCVIEWSLLSGAPTGITVFFIDEGIDTGRYVVLQQRIDVQACKNLSVARSRLFGLDGTAYAEAIKAIQTQEPVWTNDGAGRRYYVMSGLLRKVLTENWY